MIYIIFFMGLSIGFLLNFIINRISFSISGTISGGKNRLILTILFNVLLFLICFFRFGFNILFFKAVVLVSILIIVSVVDLKHKIIPNFMVILTLAMGILFLLARDISFTSALLGMLVGGGLLFLLAFMPGAMGGGDIKLMFALGAFLGLNKTLGALIIAFIVAGVISAFLLLFKLKGRKDVIPFGPFLALGSIISFLFIF